MTPTSLPTDDPILSWIAPEHLHQERTKIWYILAAIFFAICLAYSIATEAWTFTALIIVCTAVYWKMHAQEFPMKKMRMWRNGFAVNDKYNEWGNCTGYWILRGSNYHELHIERKSGNDIKIQTGDIDPFLLHDLLENLLPRLDDKGEKLLDTIIRICKL
jgi:hypothetical protein